LSHFRTANIGRRTLVNPRRRYTGQPDDIRRKPVALEGDWLHWHSSVRGGFCPETEKA
jgi:hypothetical protein